MSFDGKVALITGGSQGIGAAVARQLAAQGAKVAVVASSSLDKAKAVADAIGAAGGTARPFVCDVRKVADITRVVEEVEQALGPIDILVNAAGVYYATPLGQTTEEDYDRMVAINMKGTFFMTNTVGPRMIERGKGGKIVNFSSVAGVLGVTGRSLYCGSKAAIMMMTRAWAKELAPHDININAIAPGNTETPMNADVRTKPEKAEALAAMKKATPSRVAYTDPEEMAAIAVFLCTDAARPMHGSTLLADEGISTGL